MKETLIAFLLATFMFSAGGGGQFTRAHVITDSIYAWGPERGITWEESER